MADLEGKKLGIKLGTSTHGGLMLFAKKHGLDLKKELIDMPPSLQLTALGTGELDAIVASEPTPSMAVQRGFGHELATLGGLGNTYPLVILANRNFANTRPDDVKSFLKAISRATRFINNNPGEATAILSRVSGLGNEVITSALGRHSFNNRMSQQTTNSLKSTARFLKARNTISRLPDFAHCISKQFLKEE